MPRFFFKLQYLGTPFSGWQRQPRNFTVQECLEEHLQTQLGEKITLVASGRTDSGVHALGQMIQFDLETRLCPQAIREKVNPCLPRSVLLSGGWIVNPKYHVIKSAVWKHYRYLLYRHGVRSPLYEDRAWVFNFPLDEAAMKEAAMALLGIHDFTSFRATDGSAATSERDLKKCRLRFNRDWIVFDLIANGFLKHMVRNIVGTLVDIGLHKKTADSIPRILEAKNRAEAGRNAPPQGLYLMHVHYPKELFKG